MILTLTPNPSIDRTVELAGPLQRGEVQRVTRVVSQGGGKGVNISRAAVSAGIPSIAVLPADKDDPFVHELLSAGIDARPSRPAGEIRVNLAVTEPDGTTTKLNSPGATMDAEHLEDLSRTLLHRAATVELGRARRVAAAGRPRRLLRPPGHRPARLPREGGRRHQRGTAARPGRRPARARRPT